MRKGQPAQQQCQQKLHCTLTGQQHSWGSRWHNSGAERGARNTAAEQLRTQAPRRHTRVVQLPAQQPETALGRTRLRSQDAQDCRRPSTETGPPTGLFSDTPTSMLLGIPKGARCVQSFDDSLDSASRKTYRISLRSSSLWEPRYPLLKVV